MHRLIAAALFITAAFSAERIPAQELLLRFNPADTKVEFTLSDVLHTVHGSFKLKRGEIRFDPATGKASGEVVIDAASGNSGSGARDSRMHKNILESQRYPEIVFTPDHVAGAVKPQGTSEVQVHGMFNIHGAGHELVMPVQVEAASGRMTASTHFDVPYVKWGMKNPSTLFLRVSDKVRIDIKSIAESAPGGG